MIIRAVAILLLTAATAQAATFEPYKTAVLRGVDKITGRVAVIEAEAGATVRFGTLFITAHTCQKTPAIETPEASAFLDIDEVKAGASVPQRWYSGWMFASSPALSPLQHPVYDIWVVDCKYRVGGEEAAPAEETAPADNAASAAGE